MSAEKLRGLTLVDTVRIDKWLWAARLFKTRSMATDAVSGGKVHLNGERTKPARKVQAGDVLVVSKGVYQLTLNVVGCTDKRVSASLVEHLYEETPESQQRREQLREQMKLENAAFASPMTKPDKKQRRDIRRIRGRDV